MSGTEKAETPEEPVKEARVPRGEAHSSRHAHGTGFGGIILVLLGLLFLGINYGWFGADVWSGLARFWPVILILLGLRIILPRERVFSWFVLLLAVAFFGFVAIGPPSLRNWNLPGNSTVQTNQSFSDDVGSAKHLKLDLDFGAAEVTVKPLAADSNKLYQADFMGSLSIDKTYDVSNERATVTIREQNHMMMWWGQSNRKVTLYLSRQVPIDLILNTGASKLNADLSDLKLENLNLSAGAASIDLKIGTLSDTVESTIDAGASSLRLSLPASMPTQITHEGGLTSQNFEKAGLMKDGDVYHTFEYGNASRHIEIDLKTGASSVTLDRYGPGEFKG